MTEQSSNDNDAGRVPGPAGGPDAHGQAAMLLVESLIHVLVSRSVISLKDAIEVVQIAAEVKQEIGEELGDTPATLRKSLVMLEAISLSLAADLKSGG